MLLTITSSASPATDLGFLLHKNPDRVHEKELSFGLARVCYPEATAERCTAALIVDKRKKVALADSQVTAMTAIRSRIYERNAPLLGGTG